MEIIENLNSIDTDISAKKDINPFLDENKSEDSVKNSNSKNKKSNSKNKKSNSKNKKNYENIKSILHISNSFINVCQLLGNIPIKGSSMTVTGKLQCGELNINSFKNFSNQNTIQNNSRVLILDSEGNINFSNIDNTRLNYLNGVNDNIQTQLNSKASMVNGGASTIVSDNLSFSKALISNGEGKVAVSNITSTELNFLQGVTSNIQDQLNASSSISLSDLSDVLIQNESLYIGNNPISIQTNAQKNTSLGITSLNNITTGYSNISIGYNTMDQLTSGYKNVTLGSFSMNNTKTSFCCTSIGDGANGALTDGSGHNTSIGFQSMYGQKTGSGNVAIGSESGYGGVVCNYNRCVYIGKDTSPSGDGITNEIAIGYGSVGEGTNTISIGNTDITSIKGQVGFTTYSDRRIKKNIKNSTLGLEFINKLRPVTYNKINPADYPKELLEKRFIDNPNERLKDDDRIYNGLIAQEVEQVLKELGTKWSGHNINEGNGKQGIEYGMLVVPLIKSIQELKIENDNLKKRVEILENRRIKN